MKIVFYIWSLGTGGAEIHTIGLARDLILAGFDVTLVVHAQAADSSLLIDDRLRVVSVGGGGFHDILGWRRAVRTLNALGADRLVCVNQSAALVGTLSRYFRRRKMVFIFHSTILDRLSEKLKLTVLGRISKGFTTIFCSANQRAYWHAKGLDGPAATIRNGVDTDYFSPPSPQDICAARKAAGIGEGCIVLSLIAAFRPEKNHSALIRVARRLVDAGYEIRVLLVGDGPTRGNIRALVETLGLTDHVEFAGKQADVRPFLRLTDVAVLPSFTETFSLAALEAMACGIPMVMSDVGGANEMVENGVNGALFTLGDDDAFFHALSRYMDREACRRAGTRARALVERKFTIGRMVEDYVAFLRNRHL